MSEEIKKLKISKSLLLDCKETIKDFPLAYETYGNFNENKDSGCGYFSGFNSTFSTLE